MAGEQETTAELTVVELPPEFTKKIENKTVTAGEQEVIFETEITKGDAATKWLKNGAEIKPVESGEGQKNKVKIDGKRQKLSICNVTTAGKVFTTTFFYVHVIRNSGKHHYV